MNRVVRMVFLFAAGLCACIGAADGKDFAANDTGIPATPGKSYVYKDVDGKQLKIEVYLPAQRNPSAGKVPGVLLIHGGAWRSGDLSQFRYACNYFSSRGLVAATINYRMWGSQKDGAPPAGESRKRICVIDAKSAIRWFKQHADEWGMDPQRLIVGGGSAGGHIAVLATLSSANDPADPANIDTSVAGYLLFNPAFVLEGQDKDALVDPFKNLRPSIAPALFMFGSKDHWKSAANVLIPELKTLGTDVTLCVAEDQDHGFFNKQPWTDITLAEADQFLVTHGLLQGASPLKPPSGGEHLTLVP